MVYDVTINDDDIESACKVVDSLNLSQNFSCRNNKRGRPDLITTGEIIEAKTGWMNE